MADRTDGVPEPPAVALVRTTRTRRRRRRSGFGWKLLAAGPLIQEQQEATGSGSEYENLLNGIYDAVLVTALDGAVLETNSRALEFFCHPSPAFQALNIVNLLAGADDTLLPSIHRNLTDHRYTLIEGQCIRSDRKTFPAEIAVSRIARRGETRLCFFVRNIAERKRAQDGLREAVARLEQHDQARAQFVSNVSHELKTPLTSMLYAIYNMLNGIVGPLPSRIRRYLEMLDGDCRRMLATVTDILDLRRMDSQHLRLDCHRVPLGRLVRWTLDSLRLQARQKKVTLTVSTGTTNVFVHCDPPKMERVVLNVVGNALKFTPSGGSIDVIVGMAPDQPRTVRVYVEDSGIGIPPDLLPRVTERYFTVGDQPAGTGLGLAISKEIVQLHGGDLRLESPPVGRSQGTAASVYLPVSLPPRVMLVEDDDIVRQTVAAQVSEWGFQVVEVGNGSMAMESIKRERPDLILLDLQLPGLEGTEVILKLKANLEMMRTPIIVLTGLRLNEKQEKVLANYGIPTLNKPWAEDELRYQVETAFLGAASVIRRPQDKAEKKAPRRVRF